jgi:hypothetical protein
MSLEVRGLFYQAIKNLLPEVERLLDPELVRHFEGEIDVDGWYDGAACVEAFDFLTTHVSPETMELMGNEFVEIARDYIAKSDLHTPRDFIEKVPAVYEGSVRGEGAGGWCVEESRPGRVVIRETGFVPNVDFITGVIERVVAILGGLNVRVTVLDDAARGAPANRYLVEWIEPDAA